MNAQTIAAFRNPPHRWRTMAWLTLAIVAAIAGWLQPELLDPASWGDWLSDPGPLAWAALLALQCLAAVLMIPSLPMVVASAVLFPEHPGWVWLLALSGVVLTVGVVWWASRIGALVAGVMVSVPAWRSLDPLAVLWEAGEDRDEEEDVPADTEDAQRRQIAGEGES